MQELIPHNEWFTNPDISKGKFLTQFNATKKEIQTYRQGLKNTDSLLGKDTNSNNASPKSPDPVGIR